MPTGTVTEVRPPKVTRRAVPATRSAEPAVTARATLIALKVTSFVPNVLARRTRIGEPPSVGWTNIRSV